LPKGKFKIQKANHETIIIETTIGNDYRFTIPKAIQHLINPQERLRITIEKIKK